MTFDFRSVPRGGKLAVTFFPGLVEHSLRHFLEEQGITGWSIVSKRDALVRFPDTKVPEDIRLYPGSPRVETHVRCLVSYYDPDAMYAEILKVNDSPENRDYLAGLSNQYFKEEECAMEDQHPDPAPAQPFPWYDDRVEAVRKEYVNPWAEEDAPEPEQYDTPRAIYGYLDRLVWKQDAAKKAAAVIAYNAFKRGVKSNALVIGPSGCGKTYIWRCLQKIFPGRIVIEDVSNLTNDGWKGSKKWADLLRSPIFRNGHHNILVLDEADKMCSPRFSHDENVSYAIQSEGLTMLEGARVDVKIDSVIHFIDTSKISFVLCGAFSNKARDVAEKSAGGRIGFGADPKAVQPYARPLNEADLIEFGVMPELLGRVQRLVHLEPMTEEDYYRMTDSSLGFLSHIGEQYKAHIRLTPQKRRELAGLATQTGLGVRGMESQIRRLVDDAIFDDCDRRCFEFCPKGGGHMELIFDFDQRQGIANVRFEGLDGTEGVTSTKQALSLLKIRNPACAFADAAKTGAYDDLSDAEYKRLLEAVTCISSLWHRPGDQPDAKTQYDMSPLMLLANAIEALSRLNAQCQTQGPEHP